MGNNSLKGLIKSYSILLKQKNNKHIKSYLECLGTVINLYLSDINTFLEAVKQLTAEERMNLRSALFFGKEKNKHNDEMLKLIQIEELGVLLSEVNNISDFMAVLKYAKDGGIDCKEIYGWHDQHGNNILFYFVEKEYDILALLFNQLIQYKLLNTLINEKNQGISPLFFLCSGDSISLEKLTLFLKQGENLDIQVGKIKNSPCYLIGLLMQKYFYSYKGFLLSIQYSKTLLDSPYEINGEFGNLLWFLSNYKLSEDQPFNEGSEHGKVFLYLIEHRINFLLDPKSPVLFYWLLKFDQFRWLLEHPIVTEALENFKRMHTKEEYLALLKNKSGMNPLDPRMNSNVESIVNFCPDLLLENNEYDKPLFYQVMLCESYSEWEKFFALFKKYFPKEDIKNFLVAENGYTPFHHSVVTEDIKNSKNFNSISYLVKNYPEYLLLSCSNRPYLPLWYVLLDFQKFSILNRLLKTQGISWELVEEEGTTTVLDMVFDSPYYIYQVLPTILSQINKFHLFRPYIFITENMISCTLIYRISPGKGRHFLDLWTYLLPEDITLNDSQESTIKVAIDNIYKSSLNGDYSDLYKLLNPNNIQEVLQILEMVPCNKKSLTTCQNFEPVKQNPKKQKHEKIKKVSTSTFPPSFFEKDIPHISEDPQNFYMFLGNKQMVVFSNLKDYLDLKNPNCCFFPITCSFRRLCYFFIPPNNQFDPETLEELKKKHKTYPGTIQPLRKIEATLEISNGDEKKIVSNKKVSARIEIGEEHRVGCVIFGAQTETGEPVIIVIPLEKLDRWKGFNKHKPGDEEKSVTQRIEIPKDTKFELERKSTDTKITNQFK